MPSQEGGRRNEGGQFLKRAPAQLLGPDGQAPTLVVIKTQPLTSELFAQNAVKVLVHRTQISGNTGMGWNAAGGAVVNSFTDNQVNGNADNNLNGVTQIATQ